MDKLDHENHIFELSKKSLVTLYGDFERDNEQKDRPDAAIIIKNTRKINNESEMIGIEITSADKYHDKQYFNDRKFSKDIENKQIEECLNGIAPTRPMKLLSIPMPRYYIYESIQGKSRKYKAYNIGNKYKEIILLVSSDFLDCNNESFKSYLVPWTNHLLSKIKFPFSKVIFVCTCTQECFLIYDKKKPLLSCPEIDKNRELGSTHLYSGMIPMNNPINLNALCESSPLVVKRKPGVLKPRGKKKRK